MNCLVDGGILLGQKVGQHPEVGQPWVCQCFVSRKLVADERSGAQRLSALDQAPGGFVRLATNRPRTEGEIRWVASRVVFIRPCLTYCNPACKRAAYRVRQRSGLSRDALVDHSTGLPVSGLPRRSLK